MDKEKKKELQEQYKQVKTFMGIICLKNEQNGKIYLAGYPNLKNKWFSLKMQLDDGRFVNAELQKDWRQLGEAAFSYSVLEEKDAEDVSDVRWEVKQLEKQWLERLQPYDEKGYNKRKIQ